MWVWVFYERLCVYWHYIVLFVSLVMHGISKSESNEMTFLLGPFLHFHEDTVRVFWIDKDPKCTSTFVSCLLSYVVLLYLFKRYTKDSFVLLLNWKRRGTTNKSHYAQILRILNLVDTSCPGSG